MVYIHDPIAWSKELDRRLLEYKSRPEYDAEQKEWKEKEDCLKKIYTKTEQILDNVKLPKKKKAKYVRKNAGAKGANLRKLSPNLEERTYTFKFLFKKNGAICGICGKPGLIENMNVDHIIPKSKGGSNRLDNLQLAHIRCNHAKGNKTPQKENNS